MRENFIQIFKNGISAKYLKIIGSNSGYLILKNLNLQISSLFDPLDFVIENQNKEKTYIRNGCIILDSGLCIAWKDNPKELSLQLQLL